MATRLLLALALLGSPSGAITVRDVPALPPGVAAPAEVNDPLFPSGLRRSQLAAAWDVVGQSGLPGVQRRRFDALEGRVVVPVSSEARRAEVLRRVAAAGLPTGVVRFVAGSALPGISTLPGGPRLAPPHRAVLSGPATLAVGTTGVWTLHLTNTGQIPVHLKNGACDLYFEVWNAADVLVRPEPTSRTCTDQLIGMEVAPGETRDVLSFRWDGRDALGRALPAGTYTLLSVYWNGSFTVSPPPVTVTLR